MATSKVFDDSSSVSNPPPSYDSISTSASADSVWYKRSVFSFLQLKQTPRATALSSIRDIVSSPDFTPSSVGPIVDSCAAALPVAEFSALLQRRNIEDHTALYWAIVKKRREALWAFTKFISEFSPACSLDLRLACLATNDHDLFMRLNLGDNVNPKDKSLRRMLGCPRDEIRVFHPESETDRPQESFEVYDWDGLNKNLFFVNVNFGMFQTRLRLTQELGVEFIAQGRIWALRFYMGPEGKWHVRCSLSEHSMPVVNSEVNLAIRSHKPPPGSDTPEHLLLGLLHFPDTLVPKESSHRYYTPTEFGRIKIALDHPLDDWPMDDNDIYVDCDGTLTIALTITYLVPVGYCRNGGEE